MDKFRGGLGGVVAGAVLQPNAVVDGIFRLVDMQFAGVTVGILAPEVIDAVGDIRSLLDLGEEVARSDGVESSGRQEVQIALGDSWVAITSCIGE